MWSIDHFIIKVIEEREMVYTIIHITSGPWPSAIVDIDTYHIYLTLRLFIIWNFAIKYSHK